MTGQEKGGGAPDSAVVAAAVVAAVVVTVGVGVEVVEQAGEQGHPFPLGEVAVAAAGTAVERLADAWLVGHMERLLTVVAVSADVVGAD